MVNVRTRLTGGPHLLRFLVLAGCLLFVAPALFAESAASDEQEREAARERYTARETWETIVSLPGKVIYFPFKMLFTGAAASAAYIDETKIVARVNDILESDDGLRALKPTYASRYGAGFKVHQKGLLNPQSKLSLRTAMGLRWRQKYELSWEHVRVPGGFGDLSARYQMLSDESFFGLGPNSSQDEESNYAHEQAAVTAGFGMNLSTSVSWTIQVGYELNDILDGRDTDLPLTTDLYTESTLSGVGSRITIARLGAHLEHDSRNRLGNPSSGGQLSFDAGLAGGLEDDRFGFWRLGVDITRYYHLFYQRVLALRAGAGVVRPISNRQIPFYELNELGRRETIRGYSRGRYRDRDMVLCTAEYRFPLRAEKSKRTGLDALLFLDAGQVHDSMFDRFAIDAFKVALGCGLRLYNRDGETVRFEIGRGKEQTRFYLVLN